MAKKQKPPADEAEDEAPEGGDAEPKKKGKKGPLLLLVALPALVLLLGGAAGAMFLLKGKGGDEHAAAEGEHAPAAGGHGGARGEAAAYEVVFYEMPELLVNIRAEDGRASYLKLKVTLECDSEETIHAIEPAMPRVMDRFQSFLRELRVEDLNGSLGSYRLRIELLRRVNLAVAPAQINAVLIEEMLIQ